MRLNVGMLRRRSRVLGGLVVALALPGCWEQVGYGAGHTWSNPAENQLTAANVASLDEAWSVSFPDGGVNDEPIVSGGRVIVSAVAGSGSFGTATLDVHAFDAATGAPAWSTNVFTDSTNTQLLAIDSSIAAGSVWTGVNAEHMIGHFVECFSRRTRLDPATGSVVGEEGSFGSTAVQAGDKVVQVVGDVLPPGGCDASTPSTLVVRDSGTLATTWTAPLGTDSVLLGSLGPSVAGDRVVLFDRGGVMAYALDGCGAASCAPAWTMPLPFGAIPLGQPVAGPGDRMFVVIEHIFDPPARTELVAFSRTTGTVSWTATVGNGSEPRMGVATAGGRVYVSGGKVFDAVGCGAATCTPLWTVTPAAGAAGPVVAGGVVYEAGPGIIHVYAAAGCGGASCVPLVDVAVDGTPTGLSVSDGHLYVTNGTELTAYAP